MQEFVDNRRYGDIGNLQKDTVLKG